MGRCHCPWTSLLPSLIYIDRDGQRLQCRVAISKASDEHNALADTIREQLMRPYRDAASQQNRPRLESELIEDSHRDKRVRVGVKEPVATIGTDARLLSTHSSMTDSTSQACSSSQHTNMERLNGESVCVDVGEVATLIDLDGRDICSTMSLQESDIINVYGRTASNFTDLEAMQGMFFPANFDTYYPRYQ